MPGNVPPAEGVGDKSGTHAQQVCLEGGLCALLCICYWLLHLLWDVHGVIEHQGIEVGVVWIAV